MKKVLSVLCCLLAGLFFTKTNLSAQDIQPGSEEIKSSDQSESIDKNSRSKTEVFTNGLIIIKEKRIANIENATTTTVVTGKDIESHSDKTLNDTLQTVPGLTTYQHGKGHVRFRMRGFEMPYIALLVDGIPVSDVYEANVDISRISVMNASEIIINRGTCSALYGTTGTMGSINIITKKPAGLYTNVSGEYSIGGDYTFNAAHGNSIGGFYYWLTATAEKQAPYDVSKKLDRTERREWFDKFFPDDLGYNIDDTSDAAVTYLDDSDEWPHQERNTYNISAKTGYSFSSGIESGITAGYIKSEAERYSLNLYNTEEYKLISGGSQSGQVRWDNPNSLYISANSYTWRDAYTVNAAPYVNYESGNFNLKANVFYLYTYEYLDGYTDEDETIPARGWGGDHSNWRNTSFGFNIFPSYKFTSWNKLNNSILFRRDIHLEREQADPDFVGTGLGSADAADALAGDDWFEVKKMTGKQITVALEDEINLDRAVNIPVNISAGISYDAQKLDAYQSRPATRQQGRVTEWGEAMEDQYIAEDDNAIWGTRDSFNPVAGITYEPVKDFLLFRGSFSQKSKLPTMSQYSNVYPNSDVGLKPEKSCNANAGFELFFIERSVSLRTDYFINRFKDKLATVYDSENPNIKYYTNIDGEDHQGVEVISAGRFKGISDIMDISLRLSYIYLRIKNLDDSEDSLLNKGDIPYDGNGANCSAPVHQIVADIGMDFVTETSLNIFGEYTAGAIKYVMADNPDSSAGDSFSTDYYKKVKLHNPVMFNLKLSQKFMNNFEVYALCKNIFDDYAADPFNPGPGRQFYFGAKAEM